MLSWQRPKAVDSVRGEHAVCLSEVRGLKQAANVHQKLNGNDISASAEATFKPGAGGTIRATAYADVGGERIVAEQEFGLWREDGLDDQYRPSRWVIAQRTDPMGQRWRRIGEGLHTVAECLEVANATVMNAVVTQALIRKYAPELVR